VELSDPLPPHGSAPGTRRGRVRGLTPSASLRSSGFGSPWVAELSDPLPPRCAQHLPLSGRNWRGSARIRWATVLVTHQFGDQPVMARPPL
jgi:hypothetical protein